MLNAIAISIVAVVSALVLPALGLGIYHFLRDRLWKKKNINNVVNFKRYGRF